MTVEIEYSVGSLQDATTKIRSHNLQTRHQRLAHTHTDKYKYNNNNDKNECSNEQTHKAGIYIDRTDSSTTEQDTKEGKKKTNPQAATKVEVRNERR